MSDIDLILKAREERDSIKKSLLSIGNVLISLNLNVPGFPKTNQLLNDFFLIVLNHLKNWIVANRLTLDNDNEILINHAAGDYFIVPLKSNTYNGLKIKLITEQFEESHPLGRFIDVDVTEKSGEAISSGKSKICFYCRKYPAIECRRSERHDIDKIREFQEKKIKKYLKKLRISEICQKTSCIALKSILYEISLTPKPGLVDKISNGIHTDMDFQTFIDSTSALSYYFDPLVKKGFRCKTSDLPNALPMVRQIGLQMENQMFEQTNGVNTQKGLIFLMGLSLFASGFVLKKRNSFQIEYFRVAIKNICERIVQTELLNNTDELVSHGQKCFDKYKVTGIRKEAENGFPTVFNHALPILQKQNSIDDKTLILTLLTIMSELDDTNILYRSNNEVLQQLKKKCNLAIQNYSFEKYQEIIDFCNTEKISPGGSADLLSISVFIFLMNKNFP